MSITLPAILDPPEIAAAIDSHTSALVSQLTSPSPGNVPPGGSRGEIVVQFYDRKRRRTGYTGGWLGRLGGGGQTEDEVCWEEWCVQVVVARPRSEAGELVFLQSKPTIVLTRNRSDQSSTRHGIVIAKDDFEDRQYRECRQRPYTTYHNKRPESVPISNSCKPKAAAEFGTRVWRLELVVTQVKKCQLVVSKSIITPTELHSTFTFWCLAP